MLHLVTLLFIKDFNHLSLFIRGSNQPVVRWATLLLTMQHTHLKHNRQYTNPSHHSNHL